MEKIWLIHILWYPIHESSEKLTFDWKTLYNCVIGNLNSEQLVLGPDWKSKIVIFISNEAEKFGGNQHFCLMEKNWLLHILWYPIHESSEKLTFDWKTMYNCVIGNLNSEQLVLGPDWKSKIVIFISNEAEKFGGNQHFCLIEKNWLLNILWWQIHKSSEILTFDWKTLYNCVFDNLNSEQLVLGPDWKSKIVIFISNEAEKFGGNQHFCLMGKNWLLHILWYPIHESSEKLTIDWKTMYDCVIGNLNSEQLVLGPDWKSKIVIFISNEAEKFGGIQHFCLMEKNWLLNILWWQIHKSSEILTFDWKTLYNCVFDNLNSEQLVLGLEWKSKIVIVISDEAEKFGGIQHFGPMKIIWLLHMLWYPTDEPSEKLVFDWKTRYYRVIGNLILNSCFGHVVKIQNLNIRAFKSQSHSTQYLFNPERVHKFIWWFLLENGAQERHRTQKIVTFHA